VKIEAMVLQEEANHDPPQKGGNLLQENPLPEPLPERGLKSLIPNCERKRE